MTREEAERLLDAFQTQIEALDSAVVESEINGKWQYDARKGKAVIHGIFKLRDKILKAMTGDK